MFQLELVPSVSIPSPPTLHELKQEGRAFVVQTWRGWAVWMPHRRGFISGMYFDADDFGEAIAVEDEFLEKDGLEPDELEAAAEKRVEKVTELAGKWFQHGDYLTVEIDTDAKTCVVVPR